MELIDISLKLKNGTYFPKSVARSFYHRKGSSHLVNVLLRPILNTSVVCIAFSQEIALLYGLLSGFGSMVRKFDVGHAI